MHIERIRIDKFGGLRGFEADLGAGLTVLLGGNESGKTTLCAFIRAMLYGLNGKSASLAQNERKKYMPWGETAMGGSLRLRSGRDCYEIVRVFGQTKKSDTCRVVDISTGEILDIPEGQEPGQALLGLEESVFADTLFVSFRGGRISGGAELLGRIRNRMDTGEEETDLGRVQERLTSARNAIAPRIREKGELARVRREMDEARRQLMREEELKKEILQLQSLAKPVPQERLDALQSSLEETESCIRQQEQALLEQDKREKLNGKTVWIPAALSAATAVLSVLLGLLVSKYAFAGLLLAAGLAVWAAVNAGQQRAVQHKNVDTVLRALSGLRQDQAMLRQQMSMLHGGQNEEVFLRSRLALEKAKQELKQLEEVKKSLKQLEKQEEALLCDVQALEIALEELHAAAKERREGIAPQLKQEMEDMLCGLTGARYTDAAVSEDLALSLETGGEMRSWEYFSGGTAEQMYLALRLSLIRRLEKTHGTLPVLLDDPLAQYDDDRAEDALELLHRYASQDQQVILLTCRMRDAKGVKRVMRMEDVR